MSSTLVPWPGSSGSSVVKPAAAKASASGRIDCGEPVKPCRTRAPFGPPAAENGSAPGRTSVIAPACRKIPYAERPSPARRRPAGGCLAVP